MLTGGVRRTDIAGAYHSKDCGGFRNLPDRHNAITGGCSASTGPSWRPGEPADSTLKDRLFHGAYPIHEACGLVFAYLGPPGEQPPFPVYDSLIRPGYHRAPRGAAAEPARCRRFIIPPQTLEGAG